MRCFKNTVTGHRGRTPRHCTRLRSPPPKAPRKPRRRAGATEASTSTSRSATVSRVRSCSVGRAASEAAAAAAERVCERRRRVGRHRAAGAPDVTSAPGTGRGGVIADRSPGSQWRSGRSSCVIFARQSPRTPSRAAAITCLTIEFCARPTQSFHPLFYLFFFLHIRTVDLSFYFFSLYRISCVFRARAVIVVRQTRGRFFAFLRVPATRTNRICVRSSVLLFCFFFFLRPLQCSAVVSVVKSRRWCARGNRTFSTVGGSPVSSINNERGKRASFHQVRTVCVVYKTSVRWFVTRYVVI